MSTHNDASSATSPSWLLYGANGYTGQLIAAEAVRRGHRPILAGRRQDAIEAMAQRLQLPYRVFRLEDQAALRQAVSEVPAVLLAAGPFSRTSQPVVEACIAQGKHYLDITGEIGVFEACAASGAAAARAGSVVFPGVGFDVVPSDCLAAALHEALPDATELQLAISVSGGISPGTLKTMVEGSTLGKGGAVRRNGKLVAVPLGYKTSHIPFADKTRFCTTFPWGDVSTAYLSTGIANIEVYFPSSPRAVQLMRLYGVVAPALRSPWVHGLIGKAIERWVSGPDERALAKGWSRLWGRASNAVGLTVEATLETPNGYALTAWTSVTCMERVLKGVVKPGMTTPSLALGTRFIEDYVPCKIIMRAADRAA